MLQYLTRHRPDRPQVKALARRWMSEREAAPLLLPRVVHAHPRLLGALAPSARASDFFTQAFRRRLMAACCLAESAPGGYSRFCLVENASKAKAIVQLAAAAFEEAVLRLCSPFLRRRAPSSLCGPSDDA